MNSFHPARRDFLQLLGGTAGAAWLTAQWPAVLSAAQHAHDATKGKQPTTFEVLTPDQARELDAITACIIPTNETPGAREAGVVFFIDRALKTFASEDLPRYRQGLVAIQKFTADSFPGVPGFSAASAEQQQKILTDLYAELDLHQGVPRRGVPSGTSEFLQTLHFHTIFGFLVDPEGGGNRDFVGWKLIGRDPEHSFSPPFGFYDKDYPGWQPVPGEMDKK
jgi:gluconate 2-dehydrogenase subunit 3-like protein